MSPGAAGLSGGSRGHFKQQDEKGDIQ